MEIKYYNQEKNLKTKIYFNFQDTMNLTSFVLQNRSPTSVSLSMDFSRSSNVLINHPHLKFSTTLSARSTLFVAQLIPENPDLEFRAELNVSLIRWSENKWILFWKLCNLFFAMIWFNKFCIFIFLWQCSHFCAITISIWKCI